MAAQVPPPDGPQPPPNGPQPNFNRIAQIHRDLSIEMQNCQNLPAIAGTERILERFDRLERTMTEQFERITARMTAR